MLSLLPVKVVPDHSTSLKGVTAIVRIRVITVREASENLIHHPVDSIEASSDKNQDY